LTYSDPLNTSLRNWKDEATLTAQVDNFETAQIATNRTNGAQISEH